MVKLTYLKPSEEEFSQNNDRKKTLFQIKKHDHKNLKLLTLQINLLA